MLYYIILYYIISYHIILCYKYNFNYRYNYNYNYIILYYTLYTHIIDIVWLHGSSSLAWFLMVLSPDLKTFSDCNKTRKITSGTTMFPMFSTKNLQVSL